MRHIARTVAAASVGLLLAFSDDAMSQEKIVIGMPAWPSAEVTANILDMLLSERFGVETELKQRGTLTVLNEVNAGSIQIHPEIWLPNLTAALERMGGDDSNVMLSPVSVSASQNICVTRTTAEQTGISALADLTDPNMAAKFDSNGDGLGEMWIGAPTWSSTVVEKIRARSYGYDKTMTLLEMPENVAMAAVDAADAADAPIVFYCYAPHHVFALHDVVRLSEPAYDPDRWVLVDSSSDDQWLKKSRAETAWDQSKFHVGYSKSVKDSHPEIAGFLDKIAYSPDDIVAMSYAVEVDRIRPEEVARTWIEQNSDRIEEWMK
jgi:glycine betaine/proline transport system substrate-binding protein